MSLIIKSVRFYTLLIAFFACCTLLHAQTLPKRHPSIVMNPQGTHIALLRHNSLTIINISNGEETTLFSLSEGELNPPIAWDRTGTQLAFVHDTYVEIWENITSTDAAKKLIVNYYEDDKAYSVTLGGLSWSPDNTSLVLGVLGLMQVWDVERGILVDEHLSHEWTISFTTSSSSLDWIDDDLLVIGDMNGSVNLFSISDKNEIKVFLIPLVPASYTAVSAMAISHARDKVAFAEGSWSGYTGKIYVWDYAISSEKYYEDGGIYRNHNQQPITAIAWSPNDSMIASMGEDYTIQIWDAQTGETYQIIELHPNASLTSVIWSPDGDKVIYVDEDGTLHWENVVTGN